MVAVATVGLRWPFVFVIQGLSKLWAMDHFGDRDIDAFEAWKMFHPKPQAEGLQGGGMMGG